MIRGSTHKSAYSGWDEKRSCHLALFPGGEGFQLFCVCYFMTRLWLRLWAGGLKLYLERWFCGIAIGPITSAMKSIRGVIPGLCSLVKITSTIGCEQLSSVRSSLKIACICWDALRAC